MDELIRQTLGTLTAMWKHRWLGLAVAWLVGVAGAVGILLIPDKYEASARIYVDTQSILKPLMTGLAVQPNIEQQIVMLSKTLLSRPNVEKLIRMADLDLDSQSAAAKDGMVDALIKSIQIQGAPPGTNPRDNMNLYTIAYRNPDPEKAKRVVQSLVSIFVESSMGDTRKDSDSARKFIDEQIKVYENKLEVAESRLKDFKLRNLEIQMEDGRTTAARLAGVSNELTQARLELREAENSRDAIKHQILGDGKSPGDDDVAVPDIDSRIDAQKRSLDTLLQRYTEQHPDVLGARRIIRELEEQRKAEVAARKKAGITGASAALSSNPLYQQLKMSLAEAEARVASLRARVQEYESRYQHLKEFMKVAPQIEAELAQLNRDYDVNKKNYEALVSRRESASLSGNLDAVAGVADFRLIDPPRVNPQPVAPKRMLLMPATLVLSLAAGLLACFLASRMRPVFFDSRMLRTVTGLPLLGNVSLLESESARQLERSELKRFFIALGGLLVAFAAQSVVLMVVSRTVAV